MKVKQLIGRLAGHVVEMRYAEATSCLAAGTVAHPTDQELREAGFAVDAPVREKPKPKKKSKSQKKPAKKKPAKTKKAAAKRKPAAN